MQECKGLCDENDFYNHAKLFTGISNRFLYEYLNGMLV